MTPMDTEVITIPPVAGKKFKEHEVEMIISAALDAQQTGAYEVLADAIANRFDDRLNDIWLWPLLEEAISRRPDCLNAIFLAMIYQKKDYDA